MIVCVDVDYRPTIDCVAALEFAAWTDAVSVAETAVCLAASSATYVPGQFYKRELPCIRAVLELLAAPEIIVVDGYVWLGQNKPGLGAILHQSLGNAIPVIGVAKTEFVSAPAAEVIRGSSARPLYVTAEGLPLADAAAAIQSMHGPHRLPTLLKRVDRVARDS